MCNVNPNKVIKFGSYKLRKNEPMDIKIDINKLKKIGWKPKCDLKYSLIKTIKYYAHKNFFKNL